MKLDILKGYIQSSNINFLIGSGLSRPYLSTLGDIEKLLTELDNKKAEIDEEDYEIVKVSLYRSYFDNVIYPNINSEIENNQADFDITVNSYKELLLRINDIILHRHNTLLTRQINVFTTNIDLFLEKSLEETKLEFNDGFTGRLKPVYDLSNFQKSYSKTSLQYDNISEIPVFNLLKLHGSINWYKGEGNLIYHQRILERTIRPIKKLLNEINRELFISIERDKKDEEVTIEILLKRAHGIELKDQNIFENFTNQYEKLIIVNPTKAKFKETVLEEQYYEMMRIYANSLEKVNTLLFCMGFSFADEHIKNITIRAANSNPTLQIIIFAYDDVAKSEIKENLGDWKNENILIISPTTFINNCGLDDKEKEALKKRLKQFNCSAINAEIFGVLAKMVHTASKSIHNDL